MGGKNHQPCGRYLQNSTLMSRAMSLAMVELETGNIALEDIILAELDGKTGAIRTIVAPLERSFDALGQMEVALNALYDQMQAENYVDLPPMQSIDLFALGDAMVESGMHRSSSTWKKVAATMTKSGFCGMIDVFRVQISILREQTGALIAKVGDFGEMASEGELHMVLEENHVGNFKAEFATLYTTWAEFNQIFLASSLISTEVWYQFNQNGSLIERGVNLARSAA